MSKLPGYTGRLEGFRLEWWSRRTEYEVNVFRESDPPNTPVAQALAELAYPKSFGANCFLAHVMFGPEAVALAKREIEKSEVEP